MVSESKLCTASVLILCVTASQLQCPPLIVLTSLTLEVHLQHPESTTVTPYTVRGSPKHYSLHYLSNYCHGLHSHMFMLHVSLKKLQNKHHLQLSQLQHGHNQASLQLLVWKKLKR